MESVNEAGFERIRISGWRLGFDNLFSKEMREWLAARRWLLQVILWVSLLNGFLVAVLFLLPNIMAATGEAAIENPIADGVIGFFGLGGMALSIGIIILNQNEIIGEKQSGTAEWVLSKPASRSAFFLSKLSANLLGMLLAMILPPSLVALGLVKFVEPGAVSLNSFLAGTGMLALNVFFYLCLTLLLGVLADSREMALGVSLGTLLFGLIARNFIGPAALLTPWLLSDLAGVVAMGEPVGLEIWLPILSTAGWSLLFIGVALWRFKRFEF
jgi:ABC-2 type transport system permease protein